ncbi:MAG: class I SAM-dependent methyltransferase [Anaerolineae bacterium]
MQSVNFDRAADFYDATRGFPDGIPEQIGQFIAESASLQETDHVLEIGIGTGRIALPLASHVRWITGVDISHRMLQTLMNKRRTEPVFPIQADGHHLPYVDASFNAVMIVHVLHLVPDPVKILSDVQRVLKTNGRLLHCFGKTNRDEDNVVVRAWNENRPKRRTGYQWQQTAHALDTSGWKLEQETTFTYRYTDTPQKLFDAVKNKVWSSMWNVPDAEIVPVLDAITQAVETYYNGDFQAQMARQSDFTLQILSPSA